MPTLVRDPQPVEFERLVERRRQLGQDLLDDVWEAVHHMNPARAGRHADIAQQLAEILGSPARTAGLRAVDEHLQPRRSRQLSGARRRTASPPRHVYYPTVAMAVEIISPEDETWDKLGFYASRRVDELLIVHPQERRVNWLGLGSDGEYPPLQVSGLIELGAAELADRIDWPE